MIPKMPDEYKGKMMTGCGYTDTQPRQWNSLEIAWLESMRADGYTVKEIAKSMGRSESSISLKCRRLHKSKNTYGQKHIEEKYSLNQQFLEEIKPKTVLDAYCGSKSFYKDYDVITNDIDEKIEADFHCDAFKLMCHLYSYNDKFDLIDLDPFGSVFDCFDLAVKMANKGIAITLGELGHKRFKRLDYVRTHYGIDSLEDFTIENLIACIQTIGARNKKQLTVWKYKEWQNIGRVYFKVDRLKVTEQWEEKGRL